LIEKIDINFSFGKLSRKIDKILKDHMDSIKKVTALVAKDTIKSGKLKKLSPGTLYIRKHGLSPKRPYKSNSKTPLLHTGNLLASIKVVDDGISMAGYGKYHLQDYTIVQNGFTKWMQKAHSMYMVGTRVPARNPFFDPKGNLKGESAKFARKSINDLYNDLRRAMRK
tara:strand:+ start:23 stop:526 length:504 start_codon:yes stop_codon:yes gene_type:complete